MCAYTHVHTHTHFLLRSHASLGLLSAGITSMDHDNKPVYRCIHTYSFLLGCRISWSCDSVFNDSRNCYMLLKAKVPFTFLLAMYKVSNFPHPP